jgi:hypothetical protein
MWRINTRRLAGQTDECSGSVCCWIGGIRWAAQPNAQSGVLQTKNTNPNQQQDSTTMNMNSTKRLKMKIAALSDIGQRKVYNFFWLFQWSLVQRQKLTRKHTIITHEQPKIWYHLMRGWFPIFREVEVGQLVEISMLVKKAPNRWL